MVNFSEIKKEMNTTYLFIPMSVMAEVRWLLNMAGIPSNECCIKPWKQVLKHQVPAIKHLSDDERDAEIEKYYGEDSEYVKRAPAVIISHYNTDALVNALSETLFGAGDEDYLGFEKIHRAELDNDDIPNECGIHIMEPN